MPTKYTYSIANDFPNALVATDALTKEIQTSSILTALDYINTSGDDCDIWFKQSLSGGDETTLDNLVSVHEGVPIPSTLDVVIKGDKGIAVPQNAFGYFKSTVEPRDGSEVIYTTHNFCDKCTWFGDSIRVTNETLTRENDNVTFNSAHTYWIDMISGRLQDDEGLVEEQQQRNPLTPHGYQVVVRVDGVVKEMREPFMPSGGDYEVIWEEGKIVFFSAVGLSAVVTADYSYANGSTFYLKPLPNKILRVEAAEADFSSDVVVKDGISYTVFGLVEKVPQTKQYAYKRATGVVSFTNGGTTVTGVGTTFTTELKVGDYVRSESAPPQHYMVVASINSNTQITLVAPYAGSTESGVTMAYAPQPTGVYPEGTMLPLTGAKYKRITNIFQEAIGAYPYIDAVGASQTELGYGLDEFRRKSRGTKSSIQAVPFRYATVRELVAEYGLELRIKLLHDIVWEGFSATLTFYSTSYPD